MQEVSTFAGMTSPFNGLKSQGNNIFYYLCLRAASPADFLGTSDGKIRWRQKFILEYYKFIWHMEVARIWFTIEDDMGQLAARP